MKSGSKKILQIAFSLVELLVVMALLAILLGLGVSQMSGANSSIELSISASEVADLFHQARQEALMRTRDVQVRIYEVTDPDFPDLKGFRKIAIGITELGEDATDPTPVPFKKIDRDYHLPVALRFLESNKYSTLLTGQSGATKNILAGSEEVEGVSTRYVAVLFSPNNRARLSTDFDWTLTLVNSDQAGDSDDKLPRNFIALQLLPGTGKVNFIQP